MSLGKANWVNYNSQCLINLPLEPFRNVHHEAAKVTKAIRTAANKSIPDSKHTPNKRSVHWWNPQLASLRKLNDVAGIDSEKIGPL